jgi:hypothetical protein
MSAAVSRGGRLKAASRVAAEPAPEQLCETFEGFTERVACPVDQGRPRNAAFRVAGG